MAMLILLTLLSSVSFFFVTTDGEPGSLVIRFVT
jgi:hypothetical protein